MPVESDSFLAGRVTLYGGDCLTILDELPADHFHAAIVDPPYHFGSIIKRWSKTGGGDRSESRVGAFARHSKGFMGHSWDAPPALPENMIEPSFAHWMAGFIDGEGCFHVHKKLVNGCETYDCQFSLNLRDDDKSILLEIQRALGGIGTIADRPGRTIDGRDGKPQTRYCISSQADCQYLRAVLTVFPLRAKKARDFDIWCGALDAWIAHEPKSSWEDVAYFRDALMAVKKYGSVYSPSQLFHYRWARKVLRVLKPGAHLAAFGAPKNIHRLVCAIEDAGFEIRDQLAWMFGVGFAKSHDAVKAMAKAGDDAGDLFREDLEHATGKWDGWGSGLKPAYEPITLARKPLAGTIQECLREHGTGALNVDACRVMGEDEPYEREDEATQDKRYTDDGSVTLAMKPGRRYTVKRRKPGAEMNRVGGNYRPEDREVLFHGELKPGRWPANLLHDGSDEVVDVFPAKAGAVAPVHERTADKFQNTYGAFAGHIDEGGSTFHDDAGSAARFFYCTKAKQSERVFLCLECGAHTVGKLPCGHKRTASHPTVKPIDLLRYIAKLIVPKDGLVIDPFAGTGTTAEAVYAEGGRTVLIEREPQYQEHIRVRMGRL